MEAKITMNKLMKGIALGVVGLLVIFALIGTTKKTAPYTGGTFNPVTVDFSQGITLNGTPFISSTGVIGSTTNGLYNYRPVLTYTADTTLTADQSGSIINMGTAGLDLTLPSPTAANGAHYRFVVSANFATTAMTIVAGTADTLEGSLLVAGAVVDCDAGDLVSISATNENIGDFVDVFSNGTNWVIGASGALAASVLSCTG